MRLNDEALLAQELSHTIAQFWRVKRHRNLNHEIKLSEFMLLATLAHCDEKDSRGIKISDLSLLMHITPAAVTHLVNSLEEGGYVERLADSADRRLVLVRPTIKGQKIIETTQAEHLESLKGLVRFLGEKDSKELLRLLTYTLNFFKVRGQHGDKFEA